MLLNLIFAGGVSIWGIVSLITSRIQTDTLDGVALFVGVIVANALFLLAVLILVLLLIVVLCEACCQVQCREVDKKSRRRRPRKALKALQGMVSEGNTPAASAQSSVHSQPPIYQKLTEESNQEDIEMEGGRIHYDCDVDGRLRSQSAQ